jgi:hypothetical protein
MITGRLPGTWRDAVVSTASARPFSPLAVLEHHDNVGFAGTAAGVPGGGEGMKSVNRRAIPATPSQPAAEWTHSNYGSRRRRMCEREPQKRWRAAEKHAWLARSARARAACAAWRGDMDAAARFTHHAQRHEQIVRLLLEGCSDRHRDGGVRGMDRSPAQSEGGDASLDVGAGRRFPGTRKGDEGR